MTAVNPLRDPRDRRIPRVAGPCVLVLFGVTGDLARKKLIPATSDFGGRPATITLPSSSIKPRPVSTAAESDDKGEETEPKD